MINPWETEEGKKIWNTQASFFNYIRGGIRKGLWMRHPLKMQFLKDKRIRAPLGRKTVSNPEGLIWGCKCEICKEVFKLDMVQVDHQSGNHKLRNVDDLKDFITNITFATFKDLQILCHPCHKIKSHSESRGITFAQAGIEKEAIKIIKAKEDKSFLESKGVVPASNAKGRRQQIIDTLSKEVR